MEPGEAPGRALVREVFEETGLLVRPERVVGVFGGSDKFRRTYANGDNVEYFDVVFACTPLGGGLECRDGEAAEVRYFPFSELSTLELTYPVPIQRLFENGETLFDWADDWLVL